MRVDLDTGKYNVVISSSNFDVSIESGAKLDVNIGESARIDVNSAVTYIKSGKKEIDTYVEGKVKPDILEYSKVESQKFIDNYVPQTVEEYVDEVTKPSIDEYTDVKINQYNQNAVSKTDDFNTLAESLTNEYTSLAQTSEETLIQYVDSASMSAKNAKDSADVSTAQASISTAQAVISTTKASESLASANASANSAISSENSAKASAKSLSDAEGVLANTIAQKDIAVSSANSAKESEIKATSEATKSENSAKESQEFSESASLSAENASKSASSAKTSETNASQSATKSAQSEANALSYSQSAKSSSDSASNYVGECQAIKDSLGTVYKFKGSVQSVSSLPSGASIGDVYDVIDSGNNYAWTGSSWDSLGVNVDLSDYAKKGDIGDGTLTIQKNGVSIATFKANQTGDVTANIEADTLTSANAGTGISIDAGIISANTNIQIKGIFNYSTTYKAGEVVKYHIDDTDGYQYFISLQGNNQGNYPGDYNNDYWAVLNTTAQLTYHEYNTDIPICMLSSQGTFGNTPSSWRITVPSNLTILANMPTINSTTGLIKAPSGIEGYYKSSEVDEALGLKQNTLVSGTNIKTINGESLLGGGDVDITSQLNALLNNIYPVGSVYLSITETCPLATLISGSTWELVSSGKALWTGDGTNANTTIEAGLPNITGTAEVVSYTVAKAGEWTKSGAFNSSVVWDYINTISKNANGYNLNGQLSFKASDSSSIYGNSSTVQPPAYVVNVWQRTA
jgi:hypothetical protein